MPVAFRSSSSTGTTDQLVSSLNVPVPANAANLDVAVICLEQWEAGNPLVAWPTNFVQPAGGEVILGSQKLKVAWKRLTGADAGNYSLSWTGSQWSIAHCMLFTGVKTTGDPIGANIQSASSASGTAIPSVSVTTASFTPGLVHVVANENVSTHNPPTGYTEQVESDYLVSNYRISATTGTQTASGGTLGTSTLSLAILLALEPDGGGPVSTSDALKRDKQMRLGALIQM